MKKENQRNRTKQLAESGLMIALATLLSMLKLFDLPYGGSITACSSLPILILGYRRGWKSGLFAGVVYGLLQMFLGLKNVLYFSTPISIMAVVVLDYLLAFGVIGLAGVFRKEGRSQSSALGTGTILVHILRYLCHTVAGCTVWAGMSIPTTGALVYSVGYNATYMIPETIITFVAVVYLCRYLDFAAPTLGRAVAQENRQKKKSGVLVFDLLGWLSLSVGVIWDLVLLFACLQNGETGDFDITGLASVDWTQIGIISLAALLLFGVCYFVARCLDRKSSNRD